jgi:hypothetical protein
MTVPALLFKEPAATSAASTVLCPRGNSCTPCFSTAPITVIRLTAFFRIVTVTCGAL